MSKFKIGDKVECIDGLCTNLTLGRLYTVTGYNGRLIQIDNRTLCDYHSLKLVTPKPQTNFKVGDVVRVIEPKELYQSLLNGNDSLSDRVLNKWKENAVAPCETIGTVLMVDVGSYRSVIFGTISGVFRIGRDGLELVPFLHKNLIAKKYGTKVKLRNGIIGEVGYMNGDEGTIVVRDVQEHCITIALEDYNDNLKHYSNSKIDIVSIL